MATYERANLGQYNSIVCFKAVITGMEGMLGEHATAISLKAAGRTRGANLCKSLGLAQGSATMADLDDIATKLDEAVGLKGTRLCKVDEIKADGDVIKVYCSETVCSAGEEFGSSRACTFTLGAVHGALEYLLGMQLIGKQTESVLRGGTHDVFEFTPR